MKQAIETREVFSIDGLGVEVRGTYHLHNRTSGFGGNPIGRDRIGILLLNSLSLPRASTGDSAVYWADSFAEFGYPSFRIDLPGMGDSGGIIPSELLSYIASGGYAAVATASAKQLVQRFNLSGVVILGLCAGATSAIYAAADCKECSGLVLMDPPFYLPQPLRPQVRRTLTDWAARSSVGGLLSDFYDRLKYSRLLLRGNQPPKNANLALLSRWRDVASAGLPILVLKAPEAKASGAKPRVGQFDYLKYVLGLAGRKSRVVIEVIEGADHPFANRVGRAGVRQQVEKWLTSCFPLEKGEESAASPVQSVHSDTNQECADRESMFATIDCALES